MSRENVEQDEHTEALRGGFRSAFRQFKRDLPLLLGVWGVGAVGTVVWMVSEGEPLDEAAMFGFAFFLTVIPLGPMTWLRYSDRGVPWLIATAWCLVWLGALFAVLAMSDALGP